ncbi:MAG: TIGR00159 family protein [Deltaproteobacteria bacterium]|nr:MAG: TIGR00159 family protein [Deltaproteobacteria bacterium]
MMALPPPSLEAGVLEGLRQLIAFDRPPTEILLDVLDILIVAFIVYRTMLVLKGTRAMQMGIGFVTFGLLYLLAKYAELATLMSVLSWLASSAILIFVVVFQNDIRRALIRLGSKAWLTRGHAAQERIIEEVVAAATELARHRMGAIMCLERDANIFEFIKNDGINLDSAVTRELLVSLFIPESVNKTHDGAVVIRNLRIARAGLFFPLPETDKIDDPTLGSRHRAAIGITEETDAVVVVVSEERGKITLFFGNHHVPNVDATSLKDALGSLLGGLPSTKKRRWFGRARDGLKRAAKGRAPEPKPATGGVASSTRRTDGAAPKTERAPKATGDKAATATTGKHSVPSKTPIPAAVAEKAPQSSRPPVTGKGTATSKSGQHTPVKKKESATKKSGRFTAMKPEAAGSQESKSSSSQRPDRGAAPSSKRPDAVAVTTKTPTPPRVSIPMPTAADRKDDEKPAERDTDPSAGPPPSVSKPMTPTELPSSPGIVPLSGDDT